MRCDECVGFWVVVDTRENVGVLVQLALGMIEDLIVVLIADHVGQRIWEVNMFRDHV